MNEYSYGSREQNMMQEINLTAGMIQEHAPAVWSTRPSSLSAIIMQVIILHLCSSFLLYI